MAEKLSIKPGFYLNLLIILVNPIRMYINENGFITFGNNATTPYNNEEIDFLSDGSNRGAYPLSYFDDKKHFIGGGGQDIDDLDGTHIPYQWVDQETMKTTLINLFLL